MASERTVADGLLDEEVIATFMDGSRPDIRCEQHEWPFLGRDATGKRYQWWRWARYANGHMVVDLTLDRLRLVEARLTDEQWDAYLGYLAPDALQKPGWMRRAIHASAEDKVKALASVLRGGK